MGSRLLRGAFRARTVLVLVTIFAAASAAWLVPSASAHNSLITASTDCAGTVSYTATAWTGTTPASRTNTDVRVFSTTDGGTAWTQVGQGQFDQTDGFAFSGTYSAGTSTTVRLRVQEFANWGDGAQPAPPSYAVATRPTDCTTTTTTPTTATTTPTTPTVPPASLSFEKLERVGASGAFVSGPVGAAVGRVVFYRMRAENTGGTTLTATLFDPRCDARTVAPAGPVVLAPGSAVTFTCSHLLVAADVPRFVNTATVTAGSLTATSRVVATVSHGVLGGMHTTKVVKRAQPAKPVVAAASFTG